MKHILITVSILIATGIFYTSCKKSKSNIGTTVKLEVIDSASPTIYFVTYPDAQCNVIQSFQTKNPWSITYQTTTNNQSVYITSSASLPGSDVTCNIYINGVLKKQGIGNTVSVSDIVN
jgi:hypothetical protein